jgi:hypothetical protein
MRTSRKLDPLEIIPTERVERRWPEGTRDRRWLETDDFRVTMPAGAFLHWPQYPFHPYAIDGAAPPNYAAAHVGVWLRRGRATAKFVVEVRPRSPRRR